MFGNHPKKQNFILQAFHFHRVDPADPARRQLKSSVFPQTLPNIIRFHHKGII